MQTNYFNWNCSWGILKKKIVAYKLDEAQKLTELPTDFDKTYWDSCQISEN